MDYGIKGKIALVTASSAGLGLASAKALASEGVHVCIASRSRENVEAAAENIRKTVEGAEIHAYTVDMRVAAEVHRLCDAVIEDVGAPDILVNNTGGPKPGTFFELSEADWIEGYRLLVESTMILYNRLIPAMREKGWGRVVNITSTSSRQPIAGLTLSNSFRPGLLGLAKTIANEVGTDGVLINSVMPGLTMTARMTELAEKSEVAVVERLRSQIPLKRAAEPYELGAAVAWLCSNASSFITGSAIAVDGGAIRCI